MDSGSEFLSLRFGSCCRVAGSWSGVAGMDDAVLVKSED